MSHTSFRWTGGVTIHHYATFRPYSVNPVGDAMRHGDHADVARERAKVITGVDTNEGGDKWREMLLTQSQPQEESE